MTSIAVIYHSATGTTQQLARAIATGITSVAGASAIECRIKGEDLLEGRFVNTGLLESVGQADGIIFGSPTYMGSISAQFKAFADATGEQWAERAWANKVASGFTIGSNYSGDQFGTIQYMKTFASQHGMVWIGLDIPGGYEQDVQNRLGAQGGVIAQSRDANVHADDLQLAEHLGSRVARLGQLLMQPRKPRMSG